MKKVRFLASLLILASLILAAGCGDGMKSSAKAGIEKQSSQGIT